MKFFFLPTSAAASAALSVLLFCVNSPSLHACFDKLDPAKLEAEMSSLDSALRAGPKLEAERDSTVAPWHSLNVATSKIPQSFFLNAWKAVQEFTGIRYGELTKEERLTQEKQYVSENSPHKWEVNTNPSTHAFFIAQGLAKSGKSFEGSKVPVSYWISTLMTRPGMAHHFLTSRAAFESYSFKEAVLVLFFARKVVERSRVNSDALFLKDLLQLVALRTELLPEDIAALKGWFGEAGYFPLIKQSIANRDSAKKEKSRAYILEKISASSGTLDLVEAKEIIHMFERQYLYGNYDVRSPGGFVKAVPLKAGELMHVLNSLSTNDAGPFLLELMRSTFYGNNSLHWNWYAWRDVHAVAKKRIDGSYEHRNAILEKLRGQFEGERRTLKTLL